MIFEGVHVMRHGKYFWPDIPGTWRHAVEAIGLDPLRLGPAFIALGMVWIIGAGLFKIRVTDNVLLAAAILSLWYLPLGTMISLMILGLLHIPRLM